MGEDGLGAGAASPSVTGSTSNPQALFMVPASVMQMFSNPQWMMPSAGIPNYSSQQQHAQQQQLPQAPPPPVQQMEPQSAHTQRSSQIEQAQYGLGQTKRKHEPQNEAVLRRKHSNRESARRSRERKQAERDRLAAEVRRLSAERNNLWEYMRELELENERLVERLREVGAADPPPKKQRPDYLTPPEEISQSQQEAPPQGQNPSHGHGGPQAQHASTPSTIRSWNGS